LGSRGRPGSIKFQIRMNKRKAVYAPRKKVAKKTRKTQVAKLNELRSNRNFKYFDFSIVSDAVQNGSPRIHSMLALLTQGVGSNNLIGTQIRFISWTVRYACFSGGDDTNTFRFIMFQNNRQAVPTGLNTLQALNIVHTPILFESRNEVIVLRDKHFAATPGFSAGLDVLAHGTEYIQGRNMMRCGFTAGGTVSEGAPYIMCLSDSAIAPNPFITIYSRIIFQDLN